MTKEIPVTMWCKGSEQQIDQKICISRQDKRTCKRQCKEGAEVMKNRKINRTRTPKQ